MKFILVLFFIGQSVFSQQYFTKNGLTHFMASEESFVPVTAKNNNTKAILTHKGAIAAQVYINEFDFKIGLMQEHFNENYMDSDTHPKATFKGNLSVKDLSNIKISQEVTITGTLTIKGVEKQIITKATLSKKDKGFYLISSFSVKPQDFAIKIPSIVRKKIAQEVFVNLAYTFLPKEN